MFRAHAVRGRLTQALVHRALQPPDQREQERGGAEQQEEVGDEDGVLVIEDVQQAGQDSGDDPSATGAGLYSTAVATSF